MNGPVHFFYKKIMHTDIDKEMDDCPVSERPAVSKVLKLQIGAFSLFGAMSAVGVMDPPYNVSTSSHELFWQTTAHLLDAASKFPATGLAVLGGWAAIETFQLRNRLNNPPTTEIQNNPEG